MNNSSNMPTGPNAQPFSLPGTALQDGQKNPLAGSTAALAASILAIARAEGCSPPEPVSGLGDLYSFTANGSRQRLVVLHSGIGYSSAHANLISLFELGFGDSIIAGSPQDFYYTTFGKYLHVLPKLLKVGIGFFKCLIIGDEKRGTMYRKGPSAKPSDVDWLGEYPINPVVSAINSGEVSSDSFSILEKIYSDSSHFTPERREKFMALSAKASPLFLSKILW